MGRLLVYLQRTAVRRVLRAILVHPNDGPPSRLHVHLVLICRLVNLPHLKTLLQARSRRAAHLFYATYVLPRLLL